MGRLATGLVFAFGVFGCAPKWTVLTESFDRVTLSSWGPTPTEVFIAGGGLGNGSKGLLLHLRNGQWSNVDLGGTLDSLWWVFGFSASDVFAVGEHGAVYHFDGSASQRMNTPTTATLFGVWGASSSDLWAVGGSPDGSGPDDVILHFDGSAWVQVAPPRIFGVAYFKVWGSAPDDVFIVGQDGLVLHYDGSTWATQTTPVRSTLLTVSGRSADDVFAVGGPPTAFVHYDGSAWASVDPVGPASGLSGVSVGPKDQGFVVGLGGLKWRRSNGRWVDDSAEPPSQDLHSVWLAADGSAIAAGGDFVVAGGTGPRTGVVAYWGTSPPPLIPIK